MEFYSGVGAFYPNCHRIIPKCLVISKVKINMYEVYELKNEEYFLDNLVKIFCKILLITLEKKTYYPFYGFCL